MNKLIKVFLMVCAAVSGTRGLYADSSSLRPPISRTEFEAALMDGHVISGRTIPGTLVMSALYSSFDLSRPAKSLWIEDSTITGDIVTPPTQARLTCPLSLKIVNSLVQGKVDLRTTDFHGDIDLSKTTFEDLVLVDRVSFKGKAIIQEAVFRRSTLFAFSAFSGQDASFSASQFEDYAGFVETTFAKRVMFGRTRFKSTTDFGGARFSDGASFHNARFEGDARFTRTVIELHSRSANGPFNNTEFLRTVSFRNARIIGSLVWVNTCFESEVYFEKLDSTDSQLSFSETKFRGLANFSGMKVKELVFKGEPSYFEKAALFRDLACQQAEFLGTEFHELADFSGSAFSRRLSLDNTRFMGDVDLQEIKLNSQANNNLSPALRLKRVRFDRTLNLDWAQLVRPDHRCFLCAPPLKIEVDSPTTWEALAKAFDRSGNLTAKSESIYQEEVMKRDTSGKSRCSGLLQDWFWGYGTRPLRVLLWMTVLVFLFAVIYWTQTGTLVQGRARGIDWSGFWARWSFALRFSLRTSWSLDYGRANSITPLFKVLTTCQSIVFKLLVLAFVQALSNVSPLLNEFVRKLLPS